MKRIYDITERSDLDKAAGDILSEISLVPQKQAVILALQGDLGAGKTTFVQVLAALLGVTEVVTSPTFVIMKLYKTKNSQFHKLVHVDAYRVESIDETRVLGLADLVTEKGTIICVEWAEKVRELLPANTINLCFELTKTGRTLVIKK